jgi:8-oxo-dGTP pyrophosphatase MutT (NUDIX family)
VPICRLADNSVGLLYTKRSSLLRSHAAQVSFPGGQCELNETFEEAALRETFEELGISPDKLDIWGKLPIVSDKTGVPVIAQIVAEIKGIYSSSILNLNSSEVSSVFVKSMQELSDPQIQRYTQFKLKNSQVYSLPVYNTEPNKIWGITAIITYQFLSVSLKQRGYRHNMGIHSSH